ncbi:MAG: hypothetical protein DCC65_10990 [Planctomycetota bacterium]|nr:MAG: hypothetical protein DCC65_10990 [Planctomycetota bacterium]
MNRSNPARAGILAAFVAVAVSTAVEGTTTVTFQQGTGGYTGAVDTYIDAGVVTANNGAAQTLVVDLSPSKKQALIRFGNLFASEGGPIPDGATITSATLTLNVATGAGTAQQIGFHRMRAAWSASDNWNTFGTPPWNTSVGIQLDNIEANTAADASTTIPDGLNVISVTNSIQAWSADPSSNFGWVLNETVDDSVTFASCDATANRPILTVTFDDPTPCTDDGDCDDLNPCTTDTCDTGSGTCTYTPVTCPWGACNPANGQCEVTLAFQDGVAGYTGTVDTFLDEANPALSHAGDTSFTMDADPTDKQGLLRFGGIFGSNGSSQIPPGSTILSATLRVNVNDASDTGALFHRMLTCWEDTDTWTTFGSGIQANGVEAVAAADVTAVQNTTGILDINVTTSVAAWAAGDVNLGWALLPGGGSGFGFDSSEGTTKPRLSVTFVPAAPCTLNTDCDDGNGCTDDVCNTGTGYCSNTPNAGNSCSDAVTCTTESCTACGVCVSIDNCTPPSVCNPSNNQCEAPPSPPHAPANPAPSNNATGISRDPQLCVDVSDPNGGILEVTFYGREVTTGGAGQDFTIIALPDTQFYSQDYPATYLAQTQWIRDNRVARNIVFVTELGDCVNTANVAQQWVNADAAFDILEDPFTTGLLDGIPYGIAVGNHDQNPGGSARSGSDENATTTDYNATFPRSRFEGRGYFGDNYPLPGFADSMDNHYELFSVSGMDFIIFHLEWDCADGSMGCVSAGQAHPTRQAVIDWMDNLLTTVYPNRRAIITSHFLLQPSGNPPAFSNQGQAVYNAIQDNPNVFMTLCGHLDQANRRRDEPQPGHVIHSMISDYQTRQLGGNGWLRILTFKPQLDQIEVRTYSPTVGQYIDAHPDNTAGVAQNNFVLDYDMDDGGPFSVIGSATTSNLPPNMSETVCAMWTGLEASTQYEWYVTINDGAGRAITTGPRMFFTTGNSCVDAGDCDDGNPCTDDACVANLCENTNNTDACADDGNPCTDDVCSGGNCTHPANDASTCTDNNACTDDDCVNGDCESTYAPTPGCCNADADCDDGKPGTTDTCTGAPGGTCSNVLNATCATNGDCNDSNPCTTDTCVGGNVSALNFDGTNDYVTMGAASGESALGARAFTLEAWIRRDGASWGSNASTGAGGVSAVPLITKGRGESDTAPLNCNYFLGITTGGTLVADFEQQAAGGGWAAGQNHPACSTGSIADTNWHHVAVTYSVADGWRFYIDGVEGTTATATCTTCNPAGSCPRSPGVEPEYNSTQHFGLGTAMNSSGVTEGFFAGIMDEVRVWNVVRTPSEIAASMDQAITSATGLIGRWSLDENTGTAAGDSTSPAQNGTLTNGPAWSPSDKAPLETGTCSYTPIPNCVPCSTVAECDDSDACTTDSCTGGICQHAPVNCDDSNPCTDDSCDSVLGCQYVNNTATCDDGDDCTTGDACAAGSCVGTPIPECCDTAADCDDSNPCTVDACSTANSAALSFDGTNDYVDFGNAAAITDFGTGSITIEGWFRADTATTALTGIFRHGRQGDFAQIAVQLASASPFNRLTASVEPAGTGAQVDTPVTLPAATFTLGAWHHFAAVIDRDNLAAQQLRLYVDGSLAGSVDATAAWGSNAITSTDNVVFGAARLQAGTLSIYFDGSIDEVRIWNHVRSLTQITDNMNEQITSAPGLVARWGLNEGPTATTTEDSVGTNDGTLNGATWITTGLVDLGQDGCTHTPIPGCCNTAGDCDDSDPCTVDSCVMNACQHDPVPGCCDDAADCDDSNPCTDDACIANVCQNTNNTATCDDGDECTDNDVCVDGICAGTPIPECCEFDTDCVDGSPCTTDVCTTPNAAALSFDGTNDYVTMGTAPGLGASTFTLECWFKWTGGGDQASSGTGGVTTGIPLIAKGRGEEDGNNKDCNYFLAIDATTGRLAADFESVDPSPNNFPVFGTTTITTNVWHHVAATYDGTCWTLYLDGLVDGTSCPARTPRFDSIQHFAIASALTSTGVADGFFAGQIDEVRVWNVARTQVQIQAWMNVPVTSGSGLLGRWALDEASGTTTADSASTPTAENGTLTNGPVWITTGLPGVGTGGCVHVPIAGCCEDAMDCDDSNPCTEDTCVANACANTPIPGCCTSAAQCDDGDPCTVDTCESNVCVNTPDTAACDDGDPCTMDICAESNDAALTFDGTNDYVTMGTASTLNTTTFTLECWFRRTGTGIGNTTGGSGIASLVPLITKGAPEADGSNLDANYIFGINTAGNVLAADFEDMATGLNHPVSGTTPVVLNTWYHAAAAYDGTTWRLYLNGSLEATLVVGSFSPRSDSIQHAGLGAMLTSTGTRLGAFAGQLDEVRIWNFARTQVDIQADMNKEIPSAAGLIGRWALDEGSGTSAADSTTPAENGTLTNGPTWTTTGIVQLIGCSHSPIPGCCTSAAQCNDSDPCTTDSCVMNACQHDPVPDCCTDAADCDDSDPCTVDTCEGNACVNTPAAPPAADAGDDLVVCASDPNPAVGGSPTGSGGSPPYTYFWTGTGAALLDDPTAANPVFDLASATAGSYDLCVTVTDSTGCSSTADCMTLTFNGCITAELGVNGLVAGTVTRTVEFAITSCSGGTEVRSISVAFTPNLIDGLGEATVVLKDVSSDVTWLSVREGHTLRRLAAVDLSTTLEATVSFTGSTKLIAGDLQTSGIPQDGIVDIIDFAILSVRWNTMVTDCTTGLPQECALGADISGDGLQATVDFTALQQNFFAVGDAADGCPPPDPPVGGTPRPRPGLTSHEATPMAADRAARLPGSGRTSISTADLRSRSPLTARADLNRDGWVDIRDLVEFADRNGLTVSEDLRRLQEQVEAPAFRPGR